MIISKAKASPAMGTREPDAVSQQQAEAARYTVLRRLSPALRHHMVRQLQPIGLIYGVMKHKFCAPEPDIKSLHIQAEEINEFAKAALAECLDISSWIAPEPEILTELSAGVMECTDLMASRLHFCGFQLVNEVDTAPAKVSRDALRMILIAALFEMTDALKEPAILTLSARVDKEEALLFLRSTPGMEGNVEPYDDGYRVMSWSDVEALVAAADAGISRQGNEVVMRFAIKPAGSFVH